MPGLLRGVARTAVVAGTATAVSNRVSRRQANRWTQQEEASSTSSSSAAQQPQYAPPPLRRRSRSRRRRPDMVTQLKELAELKDPGHPHRSRVRGPEGEDPRDPDDRAGGSQTPFLYRPRQTWMPGTGCWCNRTRAGRPTTDGSSSQFESTRRGPGASGRAGPLVRDLVSDLQEPQSSPRPCRCVERRPEFETAKGEAAGRG